MGRVQWTVPSQYPCLMQKDGLRRVTGPQDDYSFPTPQRLRKAAAKVLAALHR